MQFYFKGPFCFGYGYVHHSLLELLVYLIVIYATSLLYNCSLGNIEASYLVMNKVHLSLLQKLATQAGVIMATVWSMGTILPMYQMSYDTMLSVFLTFIEKTGRSVN